MQKSVWIFNICCVCIVCLFLAIFWEAFLTPYDGTEPTADMTTHEHLRVLGIALNQYHNDFNCYPPAWISDENGRPLLSWRVLLLPYLDNRLVYEQFHLDEPWDSPHNVRLSKTDLSIFHNGRKTFGPAMTSYVANVGADGPWRGASSVSKSDLKEMPTSTVWLAEQNAYEINWAEPRDLEVTKSLLKSDSALKDEAFVPLDRHAHILQIDGKVRKVQIN